MKVIAAYLLAVLGGNTCPSSDDIQKILGSVGIDAEEDRVEYLLSQVKGKDVTELIAAGREKLSSVPSGGGGGGAPVAIAAAAAPAAAAAEAPKKEEVVEDAGSDEDYGLDLFG